LINAKDITHKDIVPGLSDRSNFQVRVRIRNVNQTTPLRITLYTVAIEEGSIQIVPGEAHIDQAPIKNIEDAWNAPIANIPYEKYREMFGGGFLDTLKGLAGTALSMAPGILAAIPQTQGIAPIAAMAANVGKSLLGQGRRTRGGQLIDTSGGAIVAAGGRKLTTSELNKIRRHR